MDPCVVASGNASQETIRYSIGKREKRCFIHKADDFVVFSPPQNKKSTAAIGSGARMIVLSLVLFFSSACSSSALSGPAQGVATASPVPTTTITGNGMLPGQQVWKQHVSSLLFGTNDTYEYKQQNIQTETSIQDALHHAGFTLLRSFFPDNASDAAIEQRMLTIERSGATCLGVITNIFNTAFNEHLVRYLGKRCQMYEFGNEADFANVPVKSYVALWNKWIPLLRQINPQAKFIGPVTFSPLGDHDFMRNFLLGVKASGILPDAISFHWYPCFNNTERACLAKASEAKQVVLNVRTMVRTILGRDVPVGVSEWNFDPGNPPPSYGDDANFMSQFTTVALTGMAQAGAAFACQFDAASYAGYGHLDMFDLSNDQPKAQFLAMQKLIQNYQP